MRLTIDVDEDALRVARCLAAHEHVTLGQAVSHLIRRGAAASAGALPAGQKLRGRYALLPARDEVIMPKRIRELMERADV